MRTMVEAAKNTDRDLLYTAIGEVLRCQRTTLNLTREKLSERAGIGLSTIVRVESAVTKISFTLLLILSENLSLKPSTILQLAERKVKKWKGE